MRVWCFPVPFFSHVISHSQFGAQLARLGVSVTVFVSTSDHDRIHSQNQLGPKWKAEGIDLQFQVLNCAGSVLAGGSSDPARFIEPFREAEESFLEFVKSSVKQSSQPSCVVSDFCSPATTERVAKLGIPVWLYTVHPICAPTAASYINRLWSQGILSLPPSPREKMAQELLISLPGYPLMRVSDLAEQVFEAHPEYQIMVCHGSRALEYADVILGSTCYDLEPDGYNALQQILNHIPSQKKPLLMAVGPTDTLPFNTNDIHKIKPEDEVFNSCMKFLDSQSPASVVYFSFGVDVNLSKEQILELIHGLDKTQHPFIGVLHPPKPSADAPVRDPLSVLPEDLRTRIASKSLLLKWAPQVEVLTHPATGAFISQCGNISVMESMSAGVPIISWPWQFEHQMTCRSLVDGVRVALEVRPWLPRDVLVTREDMEKVVNALFHSQEGAEVRGRAQKMKQAFEAAVGPHGATSKNLRALVERLKLYSNV